MNFLLNKARRVREFSQTSHDMALLLLVTTLLLLAAAQPHKAADLVELDLTPGFTRFSTGTGPQQYMHGASTGRAYGPDYPAVYRHDHLPDQPWLQLWIGSPPGAPDADLASYAALSRDLDAQAWWGQRVRFSAVVGRRYLRSSYKGRAYAALFLRLLTADGVVLAMDNMADRPITSFQQRYDVYEIVVDVPGPPADACPVDQGRSLPAVVQIGALLCGGGKGEMYFGQATLGPVPQAQRQVTGGPGPWLGPPWTHLL